MSRKKREQNRAICNLRSREQSLNCFFNLLILVLIISACSSFSSPSAEIEVQPALPTPTLEPTFTPSSLSPADKIQSAPTTTEESRSTTTTSQASLSGRIFDQSTTQPITEAQVSIGDQTTTTNANGRYTLTGLEPGLHVLSVTHPNYDPGLSSILTVAAGQTQAVNLALYAPNTSPYPQDPMLTNPLDPNGAPTAEDAEWLAREQGLTGKVVSIAETKLSGEYLVNYKIGDDIRAAVAELNHEAWELTDDTGRTWWIIKVCGNLASALPKAVPIATPVPRPLPPLAEVVVDGLSLRACASEVCAEVGTVPRGTQLEVFGCLAGGDWCEVGWSGGRGWCVRQSLRQLAVAEAVPLVQAALPTATPGVQLVDALPIKLTPQTLIMPVGFSNCFNIAELPTWDRKVLPTWSVNGLPAQTTSQFTGAGSGNPTSGCLQIKTSTSVSEGTYPIQVIATVPGKAWSAQAEIKIIACEEFEPGVYTGTMDNLNPIVVAGKPDFRNGIIVPFLICDDSQPRKLIATIESALSEAGTTLLEAPRYYLFRSLVFPAPDGIHAHSPEFPDVEYDYATNDGWSLETEVTPGLYLLVFEHDSYDDLINPREAKDIPQSVTYRVELVDNP